MKAAMLLIDLQHDFLKAPGLQPPAEVLTARAAALLDDCRRRRIPIIHLWSTLEPDIDRRLPHWRQNNQWLCVAGTAGHETPASLRPSQGETVLHKTGFNGFRTGELDTALVALGCDTVILCGVYLHVCVRTAAAECLERGLNVWVADDAVGSNDPIHAAVTRRWLAERCVQFEPSQAILSRLDGGPAPTLIHRSPRQTKDILFETPIAGDAEVTLATTSAKSAWAGWRRSERPLRRRLLEKVAERLEAAAVDLARQMALEIGKPVSHGLEEIRRAAANVRDVIRRAEAFPPEIREAGGSVRHQPLGLVALISPWNNPVAIPLGKIAPALAYGNTVVWKPAPAATNLAHTTLQLLREAGVPKDAVQCLFGGQATARRLAADENVDAVTFTGSTAAGFAVQEICARRTVPFQAELGGNNAAIIWDEASPAQVAAQIAWAAFGFAGQRCTATRRVIVNASDFEACLAELRAAAERLAWGDPLEMAVDIGPVIDSAKCEEHAGWIGRAPAGGAHRVELLHQRRAAQPWVGAGAYAQPAIVCCDRPESSLVQEETMSPVLVIQRAQDFEHALALCNGVRQGLAAALFSDDLELQQRFLAGAKAGILRLNMATAGADVSLPFGGWKASGIGPPEHGVGDPLFYTRMQTVYIEDPLI